LSVSEERTFTANSAIPNEGIEQMARKNDGASANPNTSTAGVPVMAIGASTKPYDASDASIGFAPVLTAINFTACLRCLEGIALRCLDPK
jgi:hypothetical protein